MISTPLPVRRFGSFDHVSSRLVRSKRFVQIDRIEWTQTCVAGPARSGGAPAPATTRSV
jgi:hypothetical protein